MYSFIGRLDQNKLEEGARHDTSIMADRISVHVKRTVILELENATIGRQYRLTYSKHASTSLMQ